MRLLVAEDDLRLGASLKKGFEQHHYAVDLVDNGEDALALGLAVPYDLIILDILLPCLDGYKVCKQLRHQRRKAPILFLTALDSIDQRVNGLDLGADDYLTKPFAFRELEARVRALLRREPEPREPVLRFLDLTLDPRTHEVTRGNTPLALTGQEYALLEYMMRHPRQVLSRAMIAEHLWNMDTDHLSNIIDVYVRMLRNKLCAHGEVNVIQTVRGFGYQLKEP